MMAEVGALGGAMGLVLAPLDHLLGSRSKRRWSHRR